MNIFADHSSEKLKHISCCLQAGLGKLHQSIHGSLLSLLQTLFFQVNSFWIELGYFITLSSLGFLALNASSPRTFKPKNIDLFFTSVSASTVSSMSTVEMEVFSNTQLVFLTILMLFGGEVFTSMLGLHLIRAKIYLQKNRLITHRRESDSSVSSDPNPDSPTDHIELEMAARFRDEKSDTKPGETGGNLNHKSIKILAYFVACYLLVVHIAGSTLISIYFSLIPSARKVLKIKGLNMQTFSIFTTVSTFANCGFVPTNENMMAFKKNSGLLLILIPQILMGTRCTLFACVQRSGPPRK
ncbi:UNVERIFIED_CONTAM: Sodium transporter HKT1 [Sesamum latifolium]|uniref:Sodium transporter HKT1 n=1 Tax=Sesamum latifolium TaxID=2727402 RepID=A0AAW2U1B1_9LAMI